VCRFHRNGYEPDFRFQVYETNRTAPALLVTGPPFTPRVTAATDVRLRDRGVYILAGLIEPTPARESVLEGQSPFDAIERCDASQRPPGSAGRASRQRDQTVFTAVPQFAQLAAITLGTPPRRDAPRIVLRQ
jgi:hypothetical protein